MLRLGSCRLAQLPVLTVVLSSFEALSMILKVSGNVRTGVLPSTGVAQVRLINVARIQGIARCSSHTTVLKDESINTLPAAPPALPRPVIVWLTGHFEPS